MRGQLVGQQRVARRGFEAAHRHQVGQFLERVRAVLEEATGCRHVDAGLGRVDAMARQSRRNARGEVGVGKQLQVMVVQPAQLLDVELRGRMRQVRTVEPIDQLLAREHLVVAMAPAQPRQVVDDGFGQVTLVVVLHHRHRAMALGELLPVRPVDHWYMPVARHLGAQRRQDVDLPGRVVDMVVAADHMRDAHVPIVDADAEVVGRRAVGAGDDEVIELGIANRDRPLDQIVPGDRAIVRVAKAHHRRHALGRR